VTRQALAALIVRAREDPSIRTTAQRLGATIDSSTGIARACDVIEQCPTLRTPSG
jgi:hypothetical protein